MRRPARATAIPVEPGGEYPRVVRRDGLVCVQSLLENGTVDEQCRNNEASSYEPEALPRRRHAAAVEETEDTSRSRVVADFAGMGSLSLLAAGGAAYIFPGFGAHLSIGGRITNAVALGGFANVQVMFGSGGVVTSAVFAPAIRLGDRGHVTMGLGPAIIHFAYYDIFTPDITALAGGLLFHAAFPVAGGFAIQFQGCLTFDSSGGFFTISLGLGGSVF